MSLGRCLGGYVVAVVVSFCLVVVALGAICRLSFGPPAFCSSTLLAEAPSPDGRLVAVVYLRNCGATTSYSTGIRLLGANEALGDRRGNVVHGCSGLRQLGAAWEDEATLLVTYDGLEDCIRDGRARLWGVTIRYQQGE